MSKQHDHINALKVVDYWMFFTFQVRIKFCISKYERNSFSVIWAVVEFMLNHKPVCINYSLQVKRMPWNAVPTKVSAAMACAWIFQNSVMVIGIAVMMRSNAVCKTQQSAFMFKKFLYWKVKFKFIFFFP